MNGRCWVCAVWLAMLVGCDGGKGATPQVETPKAPPAGVAVPVADAQAAVAAAVQLAVPTPGVLVVGGQEQLFPPVRLRVDQRGATMSGQLATLDPPTSRPEDEAKLNSIFLDLEITASDPEKVETWAWSAKARDEEIDETSFGIYLRGTRYRLQPFDVKATFAELEGYVIVSMEGVFLMFDTDQTGAKGVKVMVKGDVRAVR